MFFTLQRVRRQRLVQFRMFEQGRFECVDLCRLGDLGVGVWWKAKTAILAFWWLNSVFVWKSSCNASSMISRTHTYMYVYIYAHFLWQFVKTYSRAFVRLRLQSYVEICLLLIARQILAKLCFSEKVGLKAVQFLESSLTIGTTKQAKGL